MILRCSRQRISVHLIQDFRHLVFRQSLSVFQFLFSGLGIFGRNGRSPPAIKDHAPFRVLQHDAGVALHPHGLVVRHHRRRRRLRRSPLVLLQAVHRALHVLGEGHVPVGRDKLLSGTCQMPKLFVLLLLLHAHATNETYQNEQNDGQENGSEDEQSYVFLFHVFGLVARFDALWGYFKFYFIFRFLESKIELHILTSLLSVIKVKLVTMVRVYLPNSIDQLPKVQPALHKIVSNYLLPFPYTPPTKIPQ